MGSAKAKELIFTGARLSAQSAANIGLVTEQVPAGDAVRRAEEIAAILAEKGPVAMRMAKRALDGGIEVPLSEGLQIERQSYEQVVTTADRKEGLLAFAEKRKPVYLGK